MNNTTKKRQITDNEIFRFYKDSFKTPKKVLQWSKGKTIPPTCKRLMRMYAYRDLSPLDDDWQGWKICKGELIIPDGWLLIPNRIIMGNALIEIGTDNDRALRAEIMRFARLIKNILS
ncbi:regulator [Photobacterium kishitanii]|uniref:DUF3653 domain-containing protein n=1 Tax=Photobacterium kishitanii TaxID=318456 RepID=UPI000D161120|nr:DUF3653 domain-containing protein [Photobacterium kishitanii]PSU85246.1 regulator [Photobacterium kishitanii]